MHYLITVLLSATFLTLSVPSVLAQNLRFELQQAIEAKNWNRAIELVDKLIQANPQEAQQLREYRTQLQNRLPKTPTSTTQTPHPNSPAATSKPANLTPITPVNPSAWQNARLLRTIETRYPVSVAAISTDGKTLITGGTGTLEVHYLETGQSKSLLDWVPKDWKNEIKITAIAISPNGNQFITHSNAISTRTTLMHGSVIQIWNLQTGQQLDSLIVKEGFIGNSEANYNLLRYSNDGKTFFAANLVEGIIWSTEPVKKMRSLSLANHDTFDVSLASISNEKNFCYQRVDISSDLNNLATVGRTARLTVGQIQNLATGATQTLMLDLPSSNDEASKELRAKLVALAKTGCVAISPNAQQVAIGNKDTLLVSQVSTEKLPLYLLSLKNSSAQSQNSDVNLAFSPDSQVLVVGSDGNKILLLNTENGKQIATLTGRFLTFSSNGHFLVITDTKGKVQFWEIE